MPLPYQIIPEGSLARPKIVTYINDNSEVKTTYPTGGGAESSVLCVFISPKGKDNVIQTITNGVSEFMDKYGLGPYSVYGQPLLNAYAAAQAATNSNGMVHCLRVTPPGAAYAMAAVIAKYKVDSGEMSIRYVVKPSDHGLEELSDLGDAVAVTGDVDADGYTSVRLFSVAYNGRGTWGENMRFRLVSDKTTDKDNEYKNYAFQVYRDEDYLEQIESFAVTFVEDAIANRKSLYAEDIVNDTTSGSDYVVIDVNAAGFAALYQAYKTAQPTTTFTQNDFDPLLGVDKYTRNAIEHLTIEPAASFTPAAGETPVELGSNLGIGLLEGDDATIEAGSAGRDAAINALYKQAFEGRIDPNIMSKNRYPSTFIFDANYDLPTKQALMACVKKRGDCVGVLDFGTGITTHASVGAYYDANFDTVVDDWHYFFEPYFMKVRDPYSMKVVTVTGTYWMQAAYMRWIHENGGNVNVPMAGNNYGIITGHVENSIMPIFDEDLDGVIMDELAEKHCNIAKYNQRQVCVRAMQNSAQNKLSALSEMNNVLTVLAIKRSAEYICATYEYNFSEASDLARFNAQLTNLTDHFASTVRSITAHFDKSQWEAERNMIHLYIEVVNPDLVKTSIIEIDVNRADTVA